MPKNRNQKYYKCYSHNLRNFIEAHGIYPISSGVNGRTNKVFHLFTMTDELSDILTNWSNHKDKTTKE